MRVLRLREALGRSFHIARDRGPGLFTPRNMFFADNTGSADEVEAVQWETGRYQEPSVHDV